jgi:hypothetical protein
MPDGHGPRMRTPRARETSVVRAPRLILARENTHGAQPRK